MDVLWSLEVRIVMHSIGIYGCFYTFLDIYFANVMVSLQSPLPRPPICNDTN